VEDGFDLSLIGVAEASEASKDDAVVESEEFQANQARLGETRITVALEVAVARPGVVTSCGDHCQHGVAGGVEGGVAEYESWPPFFGSLVPHSSRVSETARW